MTKLEIRKKYRQLRDDVSEETRQQAAQLAAKHFTAQFLHEHCQHIACYLAFKKEFDTSPMIEAIWRAKKICYLPVLSLDNELKFVRYNKNDALKLNQFGILEPQHKLEMIETEKLDLVITPLVAFDDVGTRLGMGGGYYDKTFAFRLGETVKKPLIVGLGYELQRVKALPRDDWDIQLDSAITECKVYQF